VSRFNLVVAAGVAALGVVVVLFLLGWVPKDAPSTTECVALWNAPNNAAFRSRVSDLGYPSAEIGGAFSEDRYQGCFVTFSGGAREPWALYSATRIPGADTPLRWMLDAFEPHWGSGFPTPRDQPRPNATVEPDGSVSLA
jgi:hypothetical protein